MGAGCQSDEHIEVQVAKFLGQEAVSLMELVEQLARFRPVVLGWDEHGMVFLQGSENAFLSWFGGPAPQLSQHDARHPYQTAHRFDSLLVPPCAELIDQY